MHDAARCNTASDFLQDTAHLRDAMHGDLNKKPGA